MTEEEPASKIKWKGTNAQVVNKINRRQVNKEGQRRLTSLFNNVGKLVTRNEEEAEVLKNIFDSVFKGYVSSHTS